MRCGIGLGVVVACWLGVVAADAADDVVGLVKAKPDSGRYVETDKGFMVPYTLTIPGTEVEFAMEPIPGGTYLMGSPDAEENRNDDEGPQVEIQVAPFWIGRYEVTWSEYKQFMKLYAIFKEFEQKKMREINDDNRIDAITAPTELYDPSFTFELGDDARQPAITMTQYAAKQYTKWLSGVSGHQYRLPAESEWEYACRAGTKTAYHFGDDPSLLGEYDWYYENAEEQPQKVGQKKPNPWGLYDMHGNVSEWCLDQYDEAGYGRLKGKKATAAESIFWPTQLFPRVLRGGNWDHDPEQCRSAARMASHDIDWKAQDPNLPLSPWWFTDDPSRGVGFRLVRSLEALPRETIEKYWNADVEDIQFAVEVRLEEGRGVQGVVDRDLPEAIKRLDQ